MTGAGVGAGVGDGVGARVGSEVDGNGFDIISDHLSRVSRLYTTPHAPCDALCSA